MPPPKHPPKRLSTPLAKAPLHSPRPPFSLRQPKVKQYTHLLSHVAYTALLFVVTNYSAGEWDLHVPGKETGGITRWRKRGSQDLVASASRQRLLRWQLPILAVPQPASALDPLDGESGYRPEGT